MGFMVNTTFNLGDTFYWVHKVDNTKTVPCSCCGGEELIGKTSGRRVPCPKCGTSGTEESMHEKYVVDAVPVTEVVIIATPEKVDISYRVNGNLLGADILCGYPYYSNRGLARLCAKEINEQEGLL
jgi:hypothetical protein